MALSTISRILMISLLIVNATSKKCFVQKYVKITELTDVHILTFIKVGNPFDLIIEFKDQDVTYIREWLELTNSRIAQSKVRDGKSNKTMIDLPLVFQEGWSNLHLQVIDRHFNMTLMSEDDNEIQLFELKLEFPILYIHVEGIFTLCKEESPEWLVNPEKVVTVPLQPERMDQKLQVTSSDSATPYLLIPFESSDSKNISINTILTINTRRRRSLIIVEVFLESALVIMYPTSSDPIVLIGVHEGTVELHLDLSISATKDVKCDDSRRTVNVLLISGLFTIGVLLLLLCITIVMLLKVRKVIIAKEVVKFPSICEINRKVVSHSTPEEKPMCM
ncbi:GWK47_016212-like protein [Aratus pisonii nudivirus]|nr:GWK47_016212-like protein [Aratus pisonii nudivirus]